jgi:methyl-accepting chemotaxis protein
MAKEILNLEVKSDIGEVADNIERAADETERLDKATDKGTKGFKGMGNAIKGIGNALKAAGIGLIVGLFAKLLDVFRQNQKVLDTFNTAMEFLSITFNDFFKFLETNINTATSFMDKIFGNTAVQQVLQFGKMLGIEVITRVKNLIQGIGGLGKAIGKVFEGKFKEAGEVAGEAMNNLNKLL